MELIIPFWILQLTAGEPSAVFIMSVNDDYPRRIVLVKFSDVQKDIEKLEKETGTLFVDYNRLHRYSHAEKSEYDWKVLFEPAKKLWGSDYKICC